MLTYTKILKKLTTEQVIDLAADFMNILFFDLQLFGDKLYYKDFGMSDSWVVFTTEQEINFASWVEDNSLQYGIE